MASPTSTSRTGILSLPLEIRRMIYRDAFTPGLSHRRCKLSQAADRKNHLALLRTNRQIRAEALPIAFETVSLCHHAGRHNPLDIHNYLAKLPRDAIRSIRYLHMTIEKAEDGDRNCAKALAFLTHRHLCLDELTITVAPPVAVIYRDPNDRRRQVRARKFRRTLRAVGKLGHCRVIKIRGAFPLSVPRAFAEKHGLEMTHLGRQSMCPRFLGDLPWWPVMGGRGRGPWEQFAVLKAPRSRYWDEWVAMRRKHGRMDMRAGK